MVERLKDILKKKSNILESAERISKDEVVEEMRKLGRNINLRTCDYYARIGIIKNPYRIPGDKKVFWDKDYVINELLAVETLVSSFHLRLSQIIELSKATHYKLENLVIDILEPLELLLEKYKKIYGKEVRMRELGEFYRKYFNKVMAGKIRIKEDHIGFLKVVEDVSSCLDKAISSMNEQSRIVERGGYDEFLSADQDKWTKKALNIIEKW